MMKLADIYSCLKNVAKKQYRILNPTKEELLAYEREVLGINLTSIMSDSKLKIDTYGYKGVLELKSTAEGSIDTKNMLVASKIDNIEFKQSKAGNYFYWISIIDDRSSFKLYCKAETYNQFVNEIIKGKASLFNINIRNDFATFDKCILLDNIPFKKGYIFVIHMPFDKHSTSILEYIEDNIDVTIKKGNVQVFQNTRDSELFIEPTIDLIDKVKKLFDIKCTIELYEDFIWGESNKLIKWYEDRGI